uniref:GATA transcription factor 16-like n=1 Tax=Erigeron canadensis TaxID=72917 RepID=UPI001CB88F10|nr:GATA transcription factor 16-like [Erigeron canadensis]
MGDPKDKGSVVADDQETLSQSNRSTPPTINCSSKQTKCCTGCNTTKTPLWRGGPAGPKSLCNACGIKYNKKRRKSAKTTNGGRGDHVKLKVRLMVINQKKQDQQKQQQMIKRKRSTYERGKPWWNNLREEEQAAILLMAISCGGSFY